jgi:hypothetical protein
MKRLEADLDASSTGTFLRLSPGSRAPLALLRTARNSYAQMTGDGQRIMAARNGYAKRTRNGGGDSGYLCLAR